MEQIRILVIWVGPLTRQQHVFTLVNFLAQSDFTVEIVHFGQDSSQQKPSSLHPGIKLQSFTLVPGKSVGSFLSRLRSVWRLAKVLRVARYDILYVINSWTLPIFWPARVLAPRRCATVYHTYDWLEPGLHSRFHLLLEKYTCRHASLLVNTDRTRARLQQTLYRLPRCPLFLPNYLSKVAVLPADIARLRREMLQGLRSDNSVVLIYPTIAGKERLTLEIMQAFKLLPRDYVLVTIALDDAYGREVRRMAASSELEGRVKVYSPMSHDQVLNLIAAADLGAIFHDATSSSGNFMGNPSRLALFVACGIPFVAVATPNVEALVYKHALGICCDPNNPRELADSIKRLLNDPPGLPARKQHLRQVFAEDLNFEKHAGNLVVMLRSIARNGV